MQEEGVKRYLVIDPMESEATVFVATQPMGGGSLSGLSSEPLPSQRSRVLEAVAQDGLALELAPTAARGDAEVVSTAARQNVRALQLASKSLLGDRAFMIAQVRFLSPVLAQD